MAKKALPDGWQAPKAAMTGKQKDDVYVAPKASAPKTSTPAPAPRPNVFANMKGGAGGEEKQTALEQYHQATSAVINPTAVADKIKKAVADAFSISREPRPTDIERYNQAKQAQVALPEKPTGTFFAGGGTVVRSGEKSGYQLASAASRTYNPGYHGRGSPSSNPYYWVTYPQLPPPTTTTGKGGGYGGGYSYRGGGGGGGGGYGGGYSNYDNGEYEKWLKDLLARWNI